MKDPICVLSEDEAFSRMYEICSKIYGARNIWLKNEDILDALKEIDGLFRTVEYTGEMEGRMKLMEEAAKEISQY